LLPTALVAVHEASEGNYLVIGQPIARPPAAIHIETGPNRVFVALKVVETDNAIPVFGQDVLQPSGAWWLHVDHDANLRAMDRYPIL
jgi:hypothetical protein